MRQHILFILGSLESAIVMDFLFVLIELFSVGGTAEAVRAIGNRRF